MKYCPLLSQFDQNLLNIRSWCKNNCPNDCEFTHFIWNSQITDFYSDLQIWTNIIINHGGAPDVSLIHLPETTFLSLICNFGGLLGVWMGMSIFTITRDLANLFNKLFNNRGNIVVNLVNLKCSRVFKQIVFKK